MSEVFELDSLEFLSSLGDETVDMVYTDPPFGTQKIQTMNRKKSGSTISRISYSDVHDDYLNFLFPNIVEIRRVLKSSGTMYLHLDSKWVHYVKVECDKIFGRENFMSDVIWHWDYGGRGKNKWPAKHDTILVYAKNFGEHVFNWNDIDRLPYIANKINKNQVRDERGKVPTDVWWFSIVGTNSKERTGYPNQKPEKLIRRAIVASTNVGDLVIDPFAGAGSTAAAALSCGRNFSVSDTNPVAIETMKSRFADKEVKWNTK